MSEEDGKVTTLDIEPYPLQKVLGYSITRWEQDFAEVRLKLDEIHANRHGIPHGGIYCLLIDTASGFSGSYMPPGQPRRMAMTLSLAVNFVGQPKGTVLIATGRKVGGGQSNFFTEVELRCDEGVLVATGQGAMRYRKGYVDAPAKAEGS